MLNVTSLNTIAYQQYDAYIAAHPDTSLYHSRAWLKVLQLTCRYAPATLVAVDEQQRIVGVLPLMRVSGILRGRRLVSLPFSHCVPILTSHPDAEAALLDA